MPRCRACIPVTDQELERDRLTDRVKGLSYNWDEKDYLWYKWTMLTLFEEHKLTAILLNGFVYHSQIQEKV